MNIEQARFNMIEQQIRPWDVLDPSVLHLLAVVKREEFVPAAYRSLAFSDLEIPLQTGSKTPQLTLQPRLEARLLQELQLHKHEKVLEIGTGSGYMAALLSHKAQSVISLETDAELAKVAQQRLQAAGCSNAQVKQVTHPDQGLPEHAPFDAILLSGSVAEVPQALLDQIKVGGRLVAIVGDEPIMHVQVISRSSEHSFHVYKSFETHAPRLQGFTEHSAFHF